MRQRDAPCSERNDMDTKIRLFVDMDGTIARFHDNVNYLERMYEKGFFDGLLPFANAIEAIKKVHKLNPDIEIFVLSSCIDGEPPNCRIEKNQWIDRYIPFIDNKHRLFPAMNTNKTDVIPDGVKSTDILYDDYNKNLHEWQSKGGISVKCKNNINHKGLNGPLWDGYIIDNSKTVKEITDKLLLLSEALQKGILQYKNNTVGHHDAPAELTDEDMEI